MDYSRYCKKYIPYLFLAPALLLLIVFFFVPFFDICFATIRRLLKGTSPFHPDAEHLHHKLLNAGLSPNKTVLAMATCTIAAGLIVTHFVGADFI